MFSAATALQGGAPAPALNVRVDDTFYTTRHVYPGGYALAAKDRRLLVVRYQVKNASKQPLEYSRNTVSFAVGTDKGRFSPTFAPIHMNRQNLDELRPGETRRDETWIEMPFDAGDATLEVRAMGVTTSLPLTGTKPDATPWAKSPAQIAAPLGRPVPLGAWNVAVTRITRPAESPSYRVFLDPGETLLMADLDFQNAVSDTVMVNERSLVAQLLDGSGNALGERGTILAGNGDDYLNRTLKGNRARTKARVVFDIPAAFQPAVLLLTEPSTGRSVAVKL